MHFLQKLNSAKILSGAKMKIVEGRVPLRRPNTEHFSSAKSFIASKLPFFVCVFFAVYYKIGINHSLQFWYDYDSLFTLYILLAIMSSEAGTFVSFSAVQVCATKTQLAKQKTQVCATILVRILH